MSERKAVTVTCDDELWAWLRAEADRDRRPLAQMAKLLLLEIKRIREAK